MKKIQLKINNKAVECAPGTTLLSAALEAGIDIPHLCHDPRITPTGACRICLVEVEGRPLPMASCTLTVADGMVVTTQSEELADLRKTALELLLSEHDLSCTTCDSDGDCKLQDYSYEYGVDEKRFPLDIPDKSMAMYTEGNSAISYDPAKCIRCLRCVKVCEEVQGVEALTMKNRAGYILVTAGLDGKLNDSTCEQCGICLSTCPTGALYEAASIGKGRPKSVEKVRTTCPYCGVGCQLDLNIHKKTDRIVRVTSETGVIPNNGNTCVKGRFGMEFVDKEDRLKVPLIRKGGNLVESSWDEALDLVAEKFLRIKEESGPDALAGLSSAKTSNEDNYIMQKFVRAVLGTNNVDHCARLCHSSTVAGLARAFGSGAMTNSIEELGRVPLVFVIGSNTTDCHPVIGIQIRQAVREGRTKLIVADPRRIPLTDIADLHLQQKSGSDVALIGAMMHVILKEGLADRDFISERTENFEELENSLVECTPDYASEKTGIPAEDIIEAARMYASAESASIVYSMGITQHTTGTDNVLALADLAMITGNVGKECSGVNPLRGQNNVQGACDLGALPNVYPGYQKVEVEESRKKMEKAWGVSLPDKNGLTVVEIMQGGSKGKIKGLYIMGENPMLSDPDINHVEKALKNIDFLVVQDIFLSETALLADVVLPATSFAEKDGTFTNTERRIQLIRKAKEEPGESRDDWSIICDLSTRMGYPMSYDSASDIMDEIAAVSPIYGGIHYDRIQEVGLQWPCPDSSHPGTKFLHNGTFARGKGKFHPVYFKPQQELPDDDYPFVLTTGRLLQHWHTGTMSRRCQVLDDLVPHGHLQIHPDDAESLQLVHSENVEVSSRRGKIVIPTEVTEKVAKGSLFLAFHFHEHPANALTIAALDPIAKIPELKACAVNVRKIND